MILIEFIFFSFFYLKRKREKINSINMTLIMVAGYRGSGKDTLYKQLSDKNFKPEFNWKVYYNPNIDINKLKILYDLNNLQIIRISFADKLKEQVRKNLINEKNIDETFDTEKYKDSPISCSSSKNNDNMTFRDYCIELAAKCRSNDIDHWCKLVYDNIIENDDKNIMITDWRYENEYIFFEKLKQIISMRVYRSSIMIPDKNILSEHNLDNFVTDYLLVTNEYEFKLAIKEFPQYSEYIKLN
jgi:hypothetical protein